MFGCYDFDVKDHKLKLIILKRKNLFKWKSALRGRNKSLKWKQNEIEETLKLEKVNQRYIHLRLMTECQDKMRCEEMSGQRQGIKTSQGITF